VTTLSPAETTVVQHLANGHTRQQAANRMGRALPTVDDYLRRAREKTGALNSTHLVALAVAAGLVTLQEATP
jgi:DNA-binding CsgD family transcriptional regulator